MIICSGGDVQRRTLCFLNEVGGGKYFSLDAIGCDDRDGALSRDEFASEGIADVATSGRGVAGGGEAVTGWDI